MWPIFASQWAGLADSKFRLLQFRINRYDFLQQWQAEILDKNVVLNNLIFYLLSLDRLAKIL